MMKKKSFALLLCAIMLAAFVAGCAPKPTESTTPTAAPATSAPASAEATPEATPEAPAVPQVLRFGTNSVNGIFNPIYSDNVYDSYVVDLLFDGLVQNDETGTYYPLLAEKWEVSEDKLTYTFTLKDATFSDGSKVTADDVKFTYEWIARPDYTGPRTSAVSDVEGYEAYHTGAATEVTGIKVIDEKTVSFTTTVAKVDRISDYIYGILSKNYYNKETEELFLELNNAPMGAGRFLFDEYAPGQFVKTVVNPDYYNTEKASKLEAVQVLIIPTETQIDALLAGQVDIVQPTVNRENYDRVAGGGAQALTFVGNGYTFMGVNHEDPIVGDKLVRQALWYGVDRAKWIENEYAGFAGVGLAPISPVSWAYPDESDLNPYAFDPDKAAALLDEAGWKLGADGIREKDGKKMIITFEVYNDVPWPANFVSIAKEQWGNLGIQVEANVTDFNSVSDKVFDTRDWQLFLMGFSLSIEPNPIPIFGKVSAVPGGFNAGYFIDDHAEELFTKILAEYDVEKRAELYKEWAVYYNEVLPNQVVLAQRQELWAVGGNVKGIDKLGPYYNWVAATSDITIE